MEKYPLPLKGPKSNLARSTNCQTFQPVNRQRRNFSSVCGFRTNLFCLLFVALTAESEREKIKEIIYGGSDRRISIYEGQKRRERVTKALILPRTNYQRLSIFLKKIKLLAFCLVPLCGSQSEVLRKRNSKEGKAILSSFPLLWRYNNVVQPPSSIFMPGYEKRQFRLYCTPHKGTAVGIVIALIKLSQEFLLSSMPEALHYSYVGTGYNHLT